MSFINIYETRTLIPGMNQTFTPSQWLIETFFPRFSTFPTEKVLVDYKKGTRKMAPFVGPRNPGITVERGGFQTAEYTAPRISLQRTLSADDLVGRSFGENVFSLRTPAERQAELLAQDTVELGDMIQRTMNWQVSELLFNGKVTMKGYIDRNMEKYVEQVLDYDFTNKEVLTGTAKWDQNTLSKYDQLDEWRDRILLNGYTPSFVLMGKRAWKTFRSDPKVQAFMDIRNMQMMTLAPRPQDKNGVSFKGRIEELGLDIYCYDEVYVDDSGNIKSLVPEDHILIGSENLGQFKFGAVTQLEGGVFRTYEGKLVPKIWTDESAEQRMFRLSSRPTPVPDTVDNWYVVKVL